MYISVFCVSTSYSKKQHVAKAINFSALLIDEPNTDKNSKHEEYSGIKSRTKQSCSHTKLPL